MKRAIVIVAGVFALAAFADDAAHDRIDIDVRHSWRPETFSPSGVPSASDIAMDVSGEAPIFTSNTPGKRATFMMPLRLPVDMEQFPIFTLKYRGENIDSQNTYTCIWIGLGDDAESSNVFPLIDFEKLEFDGQPHEFRLDLRKAPQDSKGTPFETGKVSSIWVSVMSTADGPGKVQVDGVSFEAEDRPAAEAKDDERAIRVVVKDAEDHPIKGAKVIVDAERKSSARAAETNDEGLATVTPQMNETERHMVRVEAEKMASVVLLPDAANTDPIEVTLRPAVKLSGVVRDAAEKPVKGACVQVALATPHNTLVRQDPAFALAQTDENGKWEAGPVADLPEGGSVIVTHPDYIKRDAVTVSFEILKGGEYVTTLEQ